MFKIKYTLNILPIIGEHYVISDEGNELTKEDIKMLELFVQSDELVIFQSQ